MWLHYNWYRIKLGPKLIGPYARCSLDKTVAKTGHEATDTGLAYAPVSQAHGHHHIVQCVFLVALQLRQGGGGVQLPSPLFLYLQPGAPCVLVYAQESLSSKGCMSCHGSSPMLSP